MKRRRTRRTKWCIRQITDARDGSDAGCSPGPVPATPTPHERVAVGVPVHRRPLHGRLDLLPRLEPPTLESQRPEHLPPRFDQVQVRRARRLDDEPRPRVRQREQECVGPSMGRQAVEHRVHPSDAGRYPPLDPFQEVDPVGRRPTGVGWVSASPVAGIARRRTSPPPVVRRLLGPARRGTAYSGHRKCSSSRFQSAPVFITPGNNRVGSRASLRV